MIKKSLLNVCPLFFCKIFYFYFYLFLSIIIGVDNRTTEEVLLKKHTGSSMVLAGATGDNQTVKFMSTVVTPCNRTMKY